jgi:hypothetical protein
MKSKANSNPAVRNPNASSKPPSPSVPISVYRELAAELQATRAMVDSLNAKNQDLTLHNQRLRQEIQRFVQSAMHLKVLVEPTQPPVSSQGATLSPNTNARSARTTQHPEMSDYSSLPTLEETATASMIAAQLRSTDSVTEHSVETQEAPPARPSKDFSGIWLTLIVMVIMVTAFGAGFLVVRPFLPTSEGEETIENQQPSPGSTLESPLTPPSPPQNSQSPNSQSPNP